MMEVLKINGSFEETSREILAAMSFPRSSVLRASFIVRDIWTEKIKHGNEYVLSKKEVEDLLNAASRYELNDASDAGIKQGHAAGDLLRIMYVDAALGKAASFRSALRHYQVFAIGKTYGDKEPLKYSDMQLRTYFEGAAPAAHLWAAYRLLVTMGEGGVAPAQVFTPEGLPWLLGYAKEMQDFATTFVPARTRPAKPIIQKWDMLLMPESISAIKPRFQVL